jgi:gluconolactonase
LSNEYELSRKADGLKSVYSLALSGNNNWLYAFGYDTRRGFSYKVNKEHKDLLYGQEFYYIHVPDQSDGAETTSAICDNFGERIWQRRMVFRSVIIMEEVKLFYPCREM